MSNGPRHNEEIGLSWMVFVRLKRSPLKPSSSRGPTTDHNVDLQIEAAPGVKPNGQTLKPRAQACESYAYLPRGNIRELMGQFWPDFQRTCPRLHQGGRDRPSCPVWA